MTLLKERKVKKKKKEKEIKKTHILDVYRRTMVTGCVCIWNIDVKKKISHLGEHWLWLSI